MNNELTYYEKVALTRWGNFIRKEEDKGFEFSINQIKNRNAVYEVGCEGGYWLLKSKAMGFKDISGDDIDSQSLDILKNRDNSINTILKNPNDNRMFAQDSSIDLLIAVQCPDVTNHLWFYEEAMRVLKNNGILYLSVTNKQSYKGLIYKIFSKGLISYKYSIGNFKEILAKNSLEILFICGYAWMPFNRASNSSFVTILNYLEKVLSLNKLTSLSPWVYMVIRKK